MHRVVAFKRDVYAYDLLCLAFEIRPQAVLELNEEMAGWNSLIEALPQHLRGALETNEWFAKVTFPAFEVSPVVVYERS